MKNIFETLITSYIADKVGISDDFLSHTLAKNLRDNMYHLIAKDALTEAGTGNEKQVRQDKTIRSDKIYWLDRSHNDVHENEFFDTMDKFVSYLNETCYTGITDYEFHYALYEKGSFYTRHLDRFQNDGSRQFSMITYLNANWIAGDGGELSIHHENGSTQNIDPTNGKSVFFKSTEMEHEVLVTNKSRLSITGWLKK